MAKLVKIAMWAGGWLAVAFFVHDLPVLNTGIAVIGFPLWVFVLVQIIGLGSGYVLAGDEKTGSPAYIVAFVIAVIAVNFLAILAYDAASLMSSGSILASR